MIFKKYIFYDLETTGRGKKENRNSFATSPKWEQILQIAAIITDENFQITNQNMNIFCRPRTSIISQPGALLTTGRGIKEIMNAELSSYELIKKHNAPSNAFCNLGIICAKTGRAEEAVSLFKKYIYLEPTSSIDYNNLSIEQNLIKFQLPRGSYATIMLREILKPENPARRANTHSERKMGHYRGHT